MAAQVLSMLTDGGSMDHINTSLALHLIPLAQELDDHELVEQLLEHARNIASNDEERGWAKFEALKVMEAKIESYLLLAEEAEQLEGAQALSAAVNHYVALLYLAEDRLDEARATAQHALRLRHLLEDKQGLSYGMALLMAIAKRQHDEETAIAVGTERLELLMTLKDEEGQMEVLADLAHSQATIGEFNTAQDLFEQSLERAKALGSLSGQLVARWGLADLAEIREDYQTAMLVLSDALHEFIGEDLAAPAQLKQRINDLTNLKDKPNPSGDEA